MEKSKCILTLYLFMFALIYFYIDLGMSLLARSQQMETIFLVIYLNKW